MSNPTRPALQWHGGKWVLAPWIIGHFPPHRIYVEPFGGAASVLLRKPRAYAEVYNDLNGELVNLFSCLRSECRDDLIQSVALTPFSRQEYVEAYQVSDDPVERARRLIVRSFMGFGSNSAGLSTKSGFRANSNRSGTIPAHDWANYPAALALIADRFSGVVVENRPAIDVMRAHDSPHTLHYIDPPYVWDTRAQANDGKAAHPYDFEMSPQDHSDLLAFVATLSGRVIISGYPSPIYEEALSGWRRVERAAFADGARPRTEVIWLNFEADDLFSSGAVA